MVIEIFGSLFNLNRIIVASHIYFGAIGDYLWNFEYSRIPLVIINPCYPHIYWGARLLEVLNIWQLYLEHPRQL